MKKLYDIIGIILALIAIITGIIAIILMMIKLTGNSPDIITISLWAISTIITILIAGINALFPMKEDLGKLKAFQYQTIKEIKQIKSEVKNLMDLQNTTLKEIKKLRAK